MKYVKWIDSNAILKDVMMKLFSKNPIRDLFQAKEIEINRAIKQLSEEEIRTVDTEKLVIEIFNKYKINFNTIINFEKKECNVKMQEYTSSTYIGGKNFVAVVEYKIPIQGNVDLLQYYPSEPFSLKKDGVNFDIKNKYLIIPIGTNSTTENLGEEEKEKVRRFFETQKSKISGIHQSLKSECDDYDENLSNLISQKITSIKEEIIKRNRQQSELNSF